MMEVGEVVVEPPPVNKRSTMLHHCALAQSGLVQGAVQIALCDCMDSVEAAGLEEQYSLQVSRVAFL